MSQEALGEYIAKCRQEKGLSLRALARRSGVAFSAIWKLEQSLTRPEPETLEALAQALKIPYETLDRLRRGLPQGHSQPPREELTPEEGRIQLLGIVDRLAIEQKAREYLRRSINSFFDFVGD